MHMKLILSITGALILALTVGTSTGRYLVRGAWAEGHILAGRRSIAALVADSATPPSVRAKLELVQQARAFAVDSVHLRAGKSFTTYTQLHSDTLVLVLSAAYPDRLEELTWWFPIVGRVPYKGFFDFPLAEKTAKDMAADGYDVYLRPSAAFSTLGWFNDPLLSTTLNADSLDLANTVFHELTHATYWAPGQVVFNESFANFVGARAAAWFFRSRGDSASAAQTDARWADEKLLALFWQRLYTAMDSAFRAHPEDRDSRLAARAEIYGWARAELVDSLGPRITTINRAWLARVPLDNAALIARRFYLTDLDLFDQAWAREGEDVPRTVQHIIAAAKSNKADPYAGLRAWVDSTRR